MRWLARLAINALALYAATRFIPGLTYDGGWLNIVLVALMFGVLNTIVRPILKLFSIPILIVTLGLFIFVINALMLWLTGALSHALGLGFRVDGFVPAFLGALVVGFVSFLLSFFIPDNESRGRKEQNG
jgi:putative membrane protein